MNHLEHRLQYDCYQWFHNTYPQYRGLLCANLSNSKNKVDGNRNKAMGLQAGRSDMVFYFARNAYQIELKIASGKQSPAQIEWQKVIESQGFNYYIVRTLEEFQELISSII